MKFKKVLCGSLAALMAMSTTAIVAQAEEMEQVKLVTAPFSDPVFRSTGRLNSLGDGYLGLDDGFYRIGEKQIADWSSSGKLTFETIGCDLDVSGLRWWTGDFNGGYAQYAKTDDADNVLERYILHADKKNGKIETAYKLGGAWAYTTPDGYTVLEPTTNVEKGTVTFTVMKPDGTTFTSTLTSWVAHMDGASWDDYVWVKYRAVDDDKYCCYAVVDEKPDGTMTDERIYAVYGIDKQGNAVKIVGDIHAMACGDVYGGDSENVAVSFVGDSGAFEQVFSADGKKSAKFSFYGTLYYLGNTMAVGYPMGGDGYDLININTGKSVAHYSGMTAIDDDLFLAYTSDNKAAFIDGSGKVLGTFDDAASFGCEYAPVVKDGKAYLIDRKMNRVSDMVDGNTVYTLNDNFFRIDNGKTEDQQYFVTCVENKNEPAVSEPVSSTPTSSEPTSSEPISSEPDPSAPASSDTTSSGTTGGGNDNPNSGAAMALIPAALIGGAAVVVSKKRKR